MSGIKGLVGKKMQKKVKFMDEDVTISKLSVAEVMNIQEAAKNVAETEDEDAGLDILMNVIKSSVEGAEELTEDDFNAFPMDELSKLSQAIMKFSGIEQTEGKPS